MSDRTCLVCGNQYSTTFCGHCGGKPPDRGIHLDVIRGVVEAPLVAVKILPQMLIPVYFSRKISNDQVNLKQALQTFGILLATAILIIDNLDFDNNQNIRVVTFTGYEAVQSIVALGSFCFVHLILSAKSPQHEVSRPFSAYLCYTGLGSLIGAVIIAISKFTGDPSLLKAITPSIVIVLILSARCLRRVYCEVHSSFMIFLVVAFATLLFPQLFMLLFGWLFIAVFVSISSIIR